MKKWLVPLVFPLISVGAYFLTMSVGVLGNGDGTGFGGLVIMLFGLALYCAFAIPMMCLWYSKRCLVGQKYRFIFTLYPSLLIVLPYLLAFGVVLKEIETFAYGAILFAWGEVWSLIGLLIFKNKPQDGND